MDLSNLQAPAGAKHQKKRVGRGQGSGNGKTAGRGHKGQKSRSGWRHKRGFEGGQMPLHRRVPKRGFHNPFRVEYAVVNLDDLAKSFEPGDVVTVEALRACGLVRSRTGLVKVLGRGDIDKALTVQVNKISATAASKIGAAGGRVEVVNSQGVAEAETAVTPVAATDSETPAEAVEAAATPAQDGSASEDAPAASDTE